MASNFRFWWLQIFNLLWPCLAIVGQLVFRAAGKKNLPLLLQRPNQLPGRFIKGHNNTFALGSGFFLNSFPLVLLLFLLLLNQSGMPYAWPGNPSLPDPHPR